MAETKHALKTKLGIQAKKLEKQEELLHVEPKSAGGESLKESVRMLISLLVGSLVAYIYGQYPILGDLQPDQTVWVVVLTSLIVRSIDKYVFQLKKNKGQVGTGVGIDRIFTTFTTLFTRSKTVIVAQKQGK
jgi:hypothetical protein